MKLYTLDDVFIEVDRIDDLQFNEDSPRFDAVRKLRFLRPYSEFILSYDAMWSVKSKQDRLARFEKYLNDTGISLPWCDVDPVEGRRFSVYQLTRTEGLHEAKLFLVGTADEKEEALGLLELVDHTKYCSAAVVDTVEKWALYLMRGNIQ